jgi:hypothetical protein
LRPILGALRREMGLRKVLGGWIELVGFLLGWRDGWREVWIRGLRGLRGGCMDLLRSGRE